MFVPFILVASLENSWFPTVNDNSVLSADGFLMFSTYSFVCSGLLGSVTVILYVVIISVQSTTSVDICSLLFVSPIFTKSLSLIVIAVTVAVCAISPIFALYTV